MGVSECALRYSDTPPLSAAALRPPRPGAAEGERARRVGVRAELAQLGGTARGGETLEQVDQVLLAEGQAMHRELVAVDVDDDRRVALDAHGVGGVERLALCAQNP